MRVTDLLTKAVTLKLLFLIAAKAADEEEADDDDDEDEYNDKTGNSELFLWKLSWLLLEIALALLTAITKNDGEDISVVDGDNVVLVLLCFLIPTIKLLFSFNVRIIIKNNLIIIEINLNKNIIFMFM